VARGTLLKRLERAEEFAKALSPIQLSPFDEDALAIYGAMSYLDAMMEPSYPEVQPTAAYARGQELRDALYGPIIPAYLDEHLKRYTRASGEFELAFGREPKLGDILHFDHVARMHSSENYSREFGRVIEAWQRQFPQLTCPLKFEDRRLFRRLRSNSLGEVPTWEEDLRIQPEERWLSIREVLLSTDFEAMVTISALVFLGVVGVKHQCRPVTKEDLRRAETELHTQEPTGFMFGQQRFKEMLVEVMGA
jgi:hypothetical protein